MRWVYGGILKYFFYFINFKCEESKIWYAKNLIEKEIQECIKKNERKNKFLTSIINNEKR